MFITVFEDIRRNASRAKGEIVVGGGGHSCKVSRKTKFLLF